MFTLQLETGAQLLVRHTVDAIHCGVGSQNQSHPGASTAASAGAEDEAGGQTGSGAKSTAGAGKERALIHINKQNNTHRHI